MCRLCSNGAYTMHISRRLSFSSGELNPYGGGKSELCNPAYIVLFYLMMSGSKGLSPHELAHKWVKDLGTRPDMSMKVG